MTNAELIKALRWCADKTLCVDLSTGEQCPRFKYREICKQKQQMHAAADALEAADEKIADYTAAIDALDDSNDAYIKENERLKKQIVDPSCLTDRIVPFDFEKTLVHELLHLKFSLLSTNGDDMQARYVHQLIDEMARSLVDAKRYCADGERRTDETEGS